MLLRFLSKSFESTVINNSSQAENVDKMHSIIAVAVTPKILYKIGVPNRNPPVILLADVCKAENVRYFLKPIKYAKTRISIMTIVQIQTNDGMIIDEATANKTAKKKVTSARLSSFAPNSLCCIMLLAISPSTKSLTPQYTYNPQKRGEKGTIPIRTTAQMRRVIVITLAKFFIENTSLFRSVYPTEDGRYAESNLTFRHSVTDVNLSKDIRRTCRIFFNLSADVCHIYAQRLGVAL